MHYIIKYCSIFPTYVSVPVEPSSGGQGYNANRIKPNGCISFVQFFLGIAIVVCRFCLLGVNEFHIISTVQDGSTGTETYLGNIEQYLIIQCICRFFEIVNYYKNARWI
jgi:hypothetical protein